jgi:hypothetical protein
MSHEVVPMRPDEKMDTAWRLTIGTKLSKAAITHHTNVADGTVAAMRRVCGSLRAKAPAQDLSVLSWREARWMESDRPQDKTDFDSEAWVMAQAQQTADKLVKALGRMKHERREILVIALEIYDRRLPEFAAEQWRERWSALDEYVQPETDDEF